MRDGMELSSDSAELFRGFAWLAELGPVRAGRFAILPA